MLEDSDSCCQMMPLNENCTVHTFSIRFVSLQKLLKTSEFNFFSTFTVCGHHMHGCQILLQKKYFFHGIHKG